jgi:DUF2934 family protein
VADRDGRIRQRAYEIWEREGRPHGRDREHWRQAEAELAAELPAGVPRTGRVGRQKAAAAEAGAVVGHAADGGAGERNEEGAMTHAPRSGLVGRQKAAGMAAPPARGRKARKGPQ